MTSQREIKNQQRKVGAFLGGALVGVALSTIALLAIPFLDNTVTGELPVSYIVVGALFWLGLLTELVFFILSGLALARSRSEVGEDKSMKRGPIGIFGFCRNPEARIADLVMIVGILWLGVVLLAKWQGAFAVMSALLLCFLGIQFHCILNGRVYNFVKYGTNHKKGEKNYEEKS